MNPIGTLVRARMDALGLVRADLVARLGYANRAKGFRRVEELCTGNGAVARARDRDCGRAQDGGGRIDRRDRHGVGTGGSRDGGKRGACRSLVAGALRSPCGLAHGAQRARAFAKASPQASVTRSVRKSRKGTSSTSATALSRAQARTRSI